VSGLRRVGWWLGQALRLAVALGASLKWNG
jgi:hypothetical protein